MRERLRWTTLQNSVADRLREGGVDTSELEARWIIETASNGRDDVSTIEDVDRVEALVARRLAGEPLQYVLGSWGFRTLDLVVDRRVLIPRPETEQVVDVALVELDRLLGAESTSNRRRGATVVDLGCGSGAIGLSVAAERPGSDVWCVDVSGDAVAVTRLNLGRVETTGSMVTVVEGAWFDPLPGHLAGAVDLIVTNPPYVATDDRLPAAVAEWEPSSALIAGPTGLEAIEAVLTDALGWLARGGALVSEIGETQAERAKGLALAAGFTSVEIRPDLAGRDRALVARRS